MCLSVVTKVNKCTGYVKFYFFLIRSNRQKIKFVFSIPENGGRQNL